MQARHGLPGPQMNLVAPSANQEGMRAVFVSPVLLLGLSLAGSCACETPLEGPPPPLRLDEPLGPDEVRCGPVTRSTELIGGPGAYAQVGRAWRCYNNRVRFLVQDGSRPVGNSSRGGSLIDVDLVRDDEAAEGHDSFRELVVAFGANEVVPESIEVVKDEGGAGVLRVRGHPDTITLVPQAYYLRQELPALIETDYILRPDADYVEIKTRILNESDDFIGPLLYADFVTFGGEGQVHSPEHGYGGIGLFETASLLAVMGSPHVSYGYVCSDKDLLVPVADGSITAPVCRDDVVVGERAEYSRYLVVGDGTLESVHRRAAALRGLLVGGVTGVVSAADGAPAAGVFVSALVEGSADDAAARAVNQTRTDADGRYRLTLRPGTYRVVAHPEGAPRVDGGEVSVAADAEEARDLTLLPAARLLVRTSFRGRGGEALGALPAKLSLLALDETQRASAVLGELVRQGLARYEVSADGTFEVRLPPGRYRALVSRGFEHSLFAAEVDLAPGEETQLAAELTHIVDTEGLIGAEFHQHSLGSVDSNVPLPLKVLENAAEGVELAASTEHDNLADFAPFVRALGLERHLVAMVGNEVSYTAIGHFNIYPWEIDEADPFRDVGSRIWFGKTIPELFDEVRRLAGDPIVQINHPRDSGSGYFAALLFDPSSGGRNPRSPPSLPTLPPTIYDAWTADFEALEVNGSLGSPEQFTAEGWEQLRELAAQRPTDVPVLADWFGFLGSGHAVAAMGNSDSHHKNNGVGWPRNFLRVGKDAPASVTEDDVREAIRGQRVLVGNGCLVELFVGDDRPMGLAEAVAPSRLPALRVRVQAPEWIDVGFLELYVNGEARRLSLEDGTLHLDAAGALRASLPGERAAPAVIFEGIVAGLPAGDLVIVALARGGPSAAPAGFGGPFCYSAPLYVDDDGDGWRGWLQ
jgi:hypothetical protein